MEFEISLNNLRFFAFHGVFEEEKKTGNEFVVNVSLKIPYNNDIDSDDLSSTISYADIFRIVEEEMSRPRNLLEKVALEIRKRILASYTDKVISGFINIEKVHPPIPGIDGSASVSLIF